MQVYEKSLSMKQGFCNQ